MGRAMEPKRSNFTFFIVICVIVISATIICLWLLLKEDAKPIAVDKPVESVGRPVKTKSVIDYDNLKTDDDLQTLMKDRKEEYGIEQGVDIVAESDEFIKVGDATVSMKEIAEKIYLKSGDIIEKSIGSDKTDKIESFGIYVVKFGDNIWNIHFKLLKDYFERKNVNLSSSADEPNERGLSSGVGKLLKFSENMVYIYNIKERELDVDLNLIFPLNKLVVYNMDQVFSLLDKINYETVNRINFDGDTLWIPTE